MTIVKVGTRTLVGDDGSLRQEVLRDILQAFLNESAAGRRLMLVTSGAIRLGRVIAGDEALPRAVAASIGQPALYVRYSEEARKLGVTVAEVILSRPYLVRREQFLNLQQTFRQLFDRGILPIVNENNAAVDGTDWSFGDNDGLAAALAVSLGAERLVIMTHLDGLFEEDPRQNPNARLIPEIGNLSDDFFKYCSSNASAEGQGGMLSKLQAARISTAAGTEVRILNGLQPGNLQAALTGGSVGTLCKALQTAKKISNRDRWILASKSSAGSIEVDKGAAEALRQGKSLLAVGARKTYGQFDAKEVIEIIDGASHGIAYGIVDLASRNIEEMLSSGNVRDRQLIHADNIYLL